MQGAQAKQQEVDLAAQQIGSLQVGEEVHGRPYRLWAVKGTGAPLRTSPTIPPPNTKYAPSLPPPSTLALPPSLFPASLDPRSPSHPPSLQTLLGTLAGEINHMKAGGGGSASSGGMQSATGGVEAVALTLKLDELSQSMARALTEVRTLSGVWGTGEGDGRGLGQELSGAGEGGGQGG